MSDEPVLELDAVTKVYGEEPPVPALRSVSFSVRPGELVAIVGPSGCGKSTLLHVMGTLERPSSGVVRIGGVDAAGLSDRELSRLRAREVELHRRCRVRPCGRYVAGEVWKSIRPPGHRIVAQPSLANVTSPLVIAA